MSTVRRWPRSTRARISAESGIPGRGAQGEPGGGHQAGGLELVIVTVELVVRAPARAVLPIDSVPHVGVEGPVGTASTSARRHILPILHRVECAGIRVGTALVVQLIVHAVERTPCLDEIDLDPRGISAVVVAPIGCSLPPRAGEVGPHLSERTEPEGIRPGADDLAILPVDLGPGGSRGRSDADDDGAQHERESEDSGSLAHHNHPPWSNR